MYRDDVKLIDPEFYCIYNEFQTALEASKMEHKVRGKFIFVQTVKLNFGGLDHEKYSRCKQDLLKKFSDLNKDTIHIYKSGFDPEIDLKNYEDFNENGIN